MLTEQSDVQKEPQEYFFSVTAPLGNHYSKWSKIRKKA